jgi:hypothetical protein
MQENSLGTIDLSKSFEEREVDLNTSVELDDNTDSDNLTEHSLLEEFYTVEVSADHNIASDTWEDIVLDSKFVDQTEEVIDYETVSYDGRISQRQRALQIVTDLALEFKIDDLLFAHLNEVLVFYKCHWQTKKFMRILLEENVEGAELAVIFKLREYWENKDCFSRTYYQNSSGTGYINLSWLLGLAIVRRLKADDVEEAILYIEDCFEDWSRDLKVLENFRSFREYLIHLVDHMELATPHGLSPYIDYLLFPDDQSLPVDFRGGILWEWLEENASSQLSRASRIRAGEALR